MTQDNEIYELLQLVLSRVPATSAAHAALANELGTSLRTLYRWRHRKSTRPAYLAPALREYLASHPPTP